jgi:uncharacterized protein YeaC (DUF1315 family)
VNYQNLVNSLTPEVVGSFRRALELGRWQDGRELSDAQREHCMRAIIHWDQANAGETERIGYIDRSRKQVLPKADEASVPLRWDEDTGKSKRGENLE